MDGRRASRARERGLRLGSDLALVDMTTSKWADLVDPPLTTFAQPIREIGAPPCKCCSRASRTLRARRHRAAAADLHAPAILRVRAKRLRTAPAVLTPFWRLQRDICARVTRPMESTAMSSPPGAVKRPRPAVSP